MKQCLPKFHHRIHPFPPAFPTNRAMAPLGTGATGMWPRRQLSAPAPQPLPPPECSLAHAARPWPWDLHLCTRAQTQS